MIPHTSPPFSGTLLLVEVTSPMVFKIPLVTVTHDLLSQQFNEKNFHPTSTPPESSYKEGAL
ncbi:MAG: hypothetical protein AAFO91_16345 [Bacteroidota bacterium]